MSCQDDESIQQFLEPEVAEGGACQLLGYLSDAAGSNLTLARLNSLTLTLYDLESDEILNGRDGQDIKNVNGGTVADVVVSGVSRLRFTLTLAGNDLAILDDEMSQETRIALISWTYDGSTPGRKELSFVVRNLHRVP